MEQKRYTIKVIGHSKIEGHTEYTLIIENDKISFLFSERYSNLKKLNDIMKNESKNNKDFPKFPPKKFFGSEDEKFLQKRQQGINLFFEILCKNPNFSKLPLFIKYIEEKKQKFYVEKEKKDIRPPLDQSTQTTENISQDSSQEGTIVMTDNDIKNNDEDFDKIVNEFSKKFYNINSIYEKDIIDNNNSFVKFFKNNKIESQENTNLSPSDDNNFDFIGKNNGNFETIEILNKKKLDEVVNILKLVEEKYDINGIIINI